MGCNGCTACCRGDIIPLVPGDDPAQFRTVERDGKLYLERDAKGNCVYLNETGCSIFGAQPTVCRVFDCGIYFLQKTRQQRQALAKAKPRFKEIFAAGRKRVETRQPSLGGATKERT